VIPDYRKILKKQYKKGKFLIKRRLNQNNDFKKIYDLFYCDKFIAFFDTNELTKNYGYESRLGYHYALAKDSKLKTAAHVTFKTTHSGLRIDSIVITNLKILSNFVFSKRVLVEKTEKHLDIRYVTFSSPERLNEYLLNF